MDSKLVAIVPAAGVGLRAGRPGMLPKQYCSLAGEPMLRRTVYALLAEARVAQVRVAVAPDDDRADDILQGLPRTVVRPCGAATRAQTVCAALIDAGLAPATWVLVHDAARPGLPLAALRRLVDACERLNRGGLLALPVADTVKRARSVTLPARPVADGPAGEGDQIPVVGDTLSRAGLWLAQTPQMFRYGELLAALEACRDDPDITDEASAIEKVGGAAHAPLLIRGARENVKLTWPEDLAWFERWLAATSDRAVTQQGGGQ